MCRIALDTHGTRRAFSLPLERRSRPHPVRAERPPPISPREFSTKAHLGPLNHYRLGVKKILLIRQLDRPRALGVGGRAGGSGGEGGGKGRAGGPWRGARVRLGQAGGPPHRQPSAGAWDAPNPHARPSALPQAVARGDLARLLPRPPPTVARTPASHVQSFHSGTIPLDVAPKCVLSVSDDRARSGMCC